MRRAPRKAVRIVAHFEGFIPCPYWDRYGGVWTIGFGWTKGITKSTPCISKATGRRLLRRALDRGEFMAAVKSVGRRLRKREVAALLSFVYNNGPGALTDTDSSTIARRLRSDEGKTYRGRKRIYREELPRWTFSGGVELPGLVARRKAEVRLACTGKMPPRW